MTCPECGGRCGDEIVLVRWQRLDEVDQSPRPVWLPHPADFLIAKTSVERDSLGLIGGGVKAHLAHSQRRGPSLESGHQCPSDTDTSYRRVHTHAKDLGLTGRIRSDPAHPNKMTVKRGHQELSAHSMKARRNIGKVGKVGRWLACRR